MKKIIIPIILSLLLSCTHQEKREESMLSRYDNGVFADKPVPSEEEPETKVTKSSNKSNTKKDSSSNNSKFDSFCFKNKKNSEKGSILAKSKGVLVLRVFSNSTSIGEKDLTINESEMQTRVVMANALGTVNGFLGQKIGDELQQILDANAKTTTKTTTKTKKGKKGKQKEEIVERVEITEVITKAKFNNFQVTDRVEVGDKVYTCGELDLQKYYSDILGKLISEENIPKVLEAIQDKILIDAISEL